MMTDSAGAFAPPPASPQAFCAVHLSSRATGTCSRCGNYVCSHCELSATGMCFACQQRTGLGLFPFSRDGWEIGGLVSHGWTVFKRNVGPMIGLALAVFLIPMGTVMTLGVVSATIGKEAGAAISVVAQVVQQLLTLAVSLGAIAVYLDAVQNRPLTFASFGAGLRRLGAGLVQYLVVGGLGLVAVAVPIAVMAGAKDYFWVGAVLLALLVIPGIWAVLGIMFMQFELVNDPSCGPVEAIRRSWALADGKRMGMLGVGLTVAVVMFAGVIMCGVGFLATYPIGMLTSTCLYLALRNGAELPEPASRS